MFFNGCSKIVEISFDALVKGHCFTHHVITNYHKKDVLASKCVHFKEILKEIFLLLSEWWWLVVVRISMRARIPKTLTT